MWIARQFKENRNEWGHGLTNNEFWSDEKLKEMFNAARTLVEVLLEKGNVKKEAFSQIQKAVSGWKKFMTMWVDGKMRQTRNVNKNMYENMLRKS